MGRKILYTLSSGGIGLSADPLTYNYGRTKNIKMTVRKTGFCVTVERTVKHDTEHLFETPLFRDAIKKVSLIELVKYGRIGSKKAKLYVQESEGELSEYDQDASLYALTGEKLLRKLSGEWCDEALSGIIKYAKSNENRLNASLYSLILAKSKEYEMEKFMYLWMSMNGLYGYVSEQAEKIASERVKKWLGTEYGGLKFLSMILDMPYRTPDHKKQSSDDVVISRHLALTIARIPEEEIGEFIVALKTNDKTNQYMDDLMETIAQLGLSDSVFPYSLLLFWLSYQTRCKYFHSERPVPLFLFYNEYPVTFIRVLNRILEDFLDNIIPGWFCDSKMKEVYDPKIELFARNCDCDRNRHLQSCVIDGKDYR